MHAVLISPNASAISTSAAFLLSTHTTLYLQVRGYPTIKYFPGGKKDGEAEEYDGGRTGSDIVNWALEKHAQNVPPPEVYQVSFLGV